MALTKAALSEHLVTAMAFDKPTATLLVEEFFNQIAAALKKDEAVKISGLGNFYLYHKKPRLAQNPKNQQPVWIDTRKVVVFKAGKKLKERIKQGVLAEEDEEEEGQ